MREIVVYTLMFSAMLQLLMAAYAWGRRNEPAAKPLITVFILGAIWAFANGMDLSSSDLPVKIFWTKISWTAAGFGPLVFLWIVLEHLRITHLLTRLRLAFLLFPSLLIIALAWSMPHHNLLLYDFVVERPASLDILQFKHGTLYFPLILALQGISITSYYFLIQSLSTDNQIKRRQSLTILFALLIPFLVNIPSILNINPIEGLDPTPQALVLSSMLFAYAIFRYRWLDIIPLARTTLVETIPVGVLVLDAKNRIVDINLSAKQMLQVDDTIIGRNLKMALKQIDSMINSQMDEEPLHQEIRFVSPTKGISHIDVHTIPLKNQNGQFNGRILTFQDVTERKQVNERLQAQLTEIESLHAQLHEQAIRDPLTGLYNRRYMNDTLERETHRAIRHQHPLCIMMIEIDDFKQFNDNFGHDAGDVTLNKVADLVQENTRTDDIACRYGGDEFTVILPETTLESAHQCAERLCKSTTSLQLEYEGKQLGKLSLSIGVALFPKHGNTITKVLRAADDAMYRAKRAGKNLVRSADE